MPSSPVQQNAGRRALIDKIINAPLSPSKQQSAGLVADGKENLINKLLSDWANVHSAVVAGCKRSIDEMDSDRGSPAFDLSPASKRPAMDFQVYSRDGIDRTDAVKMLLGWNARTRAATEHEDDSDAHSDIASETDKVNNSAIVFQGHNHAGSSQLPTPVPAKVIPRLEPSYPSEPVAFKAFINEKATLLRHRLGLAVKKLENKWKMERLVSEIEARGPPTGLSTTAEDSPARPQSSAQLLPPAEITLSKKKSSAPPSTSDMITETGSGDSQLDAYEDGLATLMDDDSCPPLPEIQEDGAPVIIQRNSSLQDPTATTKRGEALDGLLKLMETTTEFDDLDVLPGE